MPHRSAEEREATKRRKTRNITIAGGVGGLIVLALALIFTLGGKGRAPKPPQAKAPPPTPVRRPAPKPAPPTPKPKVAKPKPKPKPTDWQAAWKDITAKAQELARHERFGDAVKAIAAIQSRLTNPRLKERARKAIAEIHRRADAAYRELEEHVSELIDAKAYAEARKALEPVVTRYGIERLVQDAKLILAEIEKREQDARLLAQWRTIKARSDRLIQTGDLAGAERTLEQARGLELDGIAGLIARQVGAIHDARRAAARRLLAAYAKESDAVWALFKAKEYAKADQRLTELAARPEFKVLAARVAADAEAAKLLKEFWRIVEKKLAAKKGQFVAFGGAAGKVVAVKNGQVTIQAGSKLETRHIHKLTAKQALRYAALGSDPRSKLLEGVFRLAEREDLDKAAKALDTAADAPAAALFKRRCAALQGHPPRK